MIPELTELGLLPLGIHRATVAEFEDRFVSSAHRRRVYGGLEKLLEEAARSGIVRGVLVAGSFVTAKPQPNDFDCVVVLDPSVLSRELRPFEYRLASKRRARKTFGGDVLPVVEGSQQYRNILEFFQTTRQKQRVGLVEIEL